MTALLPCPFCGEPARTHTYETESLFSHAQVEFLQLECTDCDIFMSGEQQDEVRAAWNRRSPNGAMCAEPNDLAREDPKKAVRTRRLLIGFAFIALCCGAGCGLAVWLVGLV